jgi:hypothetical protein
MAENEGAACLAELMLSSSDAEDNAGPGPASGRWRSPAGSADIDGARGEAHDGDGANSLDMLVEMAQSLCEADASAGHTAGPMAGAEGACAGTGSRGGASGEGTATLELREVRPKLVVSQLVSKAESARLDAWEEIELLLRDNEHTFRIRPAMCERDWGLYRESPKVPRRGKGGQRDLWTNSGGLRGATVWPAVESGSKARVRRQYGKIKRVSAANGRSELKFLEYSLVDNSADPIGEELLQRRLFQTLPVDSMGVKAIRPLRAAIEIPVPNRIVGLSSTWRKSSGACILGIPLPVLHLVTIGPGFRASFLHALENSDPLPRRFSVQVSRWLARHAVACIRHSRP